MWSLTSPLAGRASGAKKIRSPTRRDFFNSIGQYRTLGQMRGRQLRRPYSVSLIARSCVRGAQLAIKPARYDGRFERIGSLAIKALERALPLAAGRQRQDQMGPALGASRSFRLAHCLSSMSDVIGTILISTSSESRKIKTGPCKIQIGPLVVKTGQSPCFAALAELGHSQIQNRPTVMELTLDLLSNPTRDFVMWNERAGGRAAPRVAAIVMTMVGSKSQLRATPDRASRMYVERALSIAEKYAKVFDHSNPADSFVITDDFVTAGRISGAKSIPISRLKIGSFHMVEGKRLQVNSSAERYQRELAYLLNIL